MYPNSQPQQVSVTFNNISCQPADSVATLYSLSLPGLNLLVPCVFSGSRGAGLHSPVDKL